MKKILALLTALMLLVSSAAFAAEITYPLSTDGAELDVWVVQHSYIEDYNTNETTAWYEDKTGVHINWTQVPDSEAATKFTLSTTGTDYPDIYSYVLSTDQIIQCAEAGIFIPLEDLIKEHAPNIQAVLDEREDIRTAITAPDGHIYTLFKTDPATYLLVQDKLFVMCDWLEAYCTATGKAAPVTLQEFEDMLIYWRDNDMNGNGDTSDEVAIMGSAGGQNIISYLLSAFQLAPKDGLLADAEGNVSFAYTTDECREGLKWINHLYEEKLIAEETFIQDGSQLTSVVSKDDPAQRIVGAFGGFWQGVAASPASMTNAYDVYEALAPLDGPAGRQASTTGFLTLQHMGAITSSCEDPVLAIKWLDYWFTNDGMVMIDYGFEDVNWEWNDVPAINGNTPSRTFLTSRSILQNTTWQVNSVPYYRTQDSLFGRTPTDHVPYLYEGAKVYESYETITGFPQFAWCTDLDMLAENSELKLVIDDYVKTALVQFITGAVDIEDDAAWDSYLDDLNSMGLEQYIANVQTINFGA